MFRLVLSAAVAVAFVSPVQANEKLKETCIATTKIVQVAATLRQGGSKSKNVKRSLTEGVNKVEDKYVVTVGPLVDWVYSVDGNIVQQPGGPKAVANRYREDCFAYKP
ncbi:MAG: hypothetical protein AAFW87_13135 [Pseudomonadota bacterium]